MQRAFMPTQDSCSLCNTLRVADKQSFGLLVGFLLRLRRLAARVRLRADDKTFSSRQTKAGSTPSYRRTDLSVQELVNLRGFQRPKYVSARSLFAKKLPGLPDGWTTTAGRNEQARLLRLSQSDHF